MHFRGARNLGYVFSSPHKSVVEGCSTQVLTAQDSRLRESQPVERSQVCVLGSAAYPETAQHGEIVAGSGEGVLLLEHVWGNSPAEALKLGIKSILILKSVRS